MHPIRNLSKTHACYIHCVSIYGIVPIALIVQNGYLRPFMFSLLNAKISITLVLSSMRLLMAIYICFC